MVWVVVTCGVPSQKAPTTLIQCRFRWMTRTTTASHEEEVQEVVVVVQVKGEEAMLKPTMRRRLGR